MALGAALALALLIGTGPMGATPVAANDPSPAAQTAEPTEPAAAEMPSPDQGASVHAEMLAEHANDPSNFAPGPAPTTPLAAPGVPRGDLTVRTSTDGGAVAALPNGLRREVFGYLPYWYLEHAGSLDYGLLGTIAYFGVTARSDGTLARSTNGAPTAGWSGWTSAAMTNVTNQAHAHGIRVVLTVTMMSWNGDYTEMSAFLNSPAARSALIAEMAATLRDRAADGVNLDWEPVPSSLRSQFTTFVREVKAGLAAAGVGSYVTVATMAGAATWASGYDVAALAAPGAADALMVMAYDFHWSGSARAGGVAPIDSPHVFDVREAMNAYLAKVPAAKIIWGVPYYGRGWTTQDGTLNAYACKTGALCPQANATAIGRTWAPRYVDTFSGVSAHGRMWDPAGQVPWFHYFDSAQHAWTQVYYDDAASLGAKYQLVEANGLRGVGIWTLLMDVGRHELYDQIDAYFQGIWFTDILYSQFRDDILWIAEAGIAAGCGNELFCPTQAVTRGQMAAFLSRALGLLPTTIDYFHDDVGSIFEADIDRLAHAGIASGCGPGLFCPNGTVTRGQMAAFLVRALGLPPAGTDFFSDDGGSIFQADINRLAAAGITGGCGTGRYCPDSAVTRGEMAAFLRRAFGS